MNAPQTDSPYRHVPQVDALLADPGLAGAIAEHGRDPVLKALRADLDAGRAAIKAALAAGQGFDAAAHFAVPAVGARLQAELAKLARPGYGRALNATGVVIHTGLGRSPLPEVARQAVIEAMGYAVLEVERESGKRNKRDDAVSRLLAEIAGAEAATIVNNNAGATLISLAALTRGRPAIVSRGQLVEIGGSYRIPDVMALSGAHMVEVGTTNRTHLYDYERALDAHPDAGLLLRVHTSNFKVVGFTKEVELEELVALGRERGVPVLDDLGSGCFLDLAPYGLPGEPVVQRSLEAGADVVTFSGDKLLGGPQAGLVVGKQEAIDKIRQNSYYRAMRPDKLTLAGLEATLKVYRDLESAWEKIPTLRMIRAPLPELETRARELCARVAALPGVTAEVQESESRIGGGSYPTALLPTRVVAFSVAGHTPDDLAQRLRLNDPSVFLRIADDKLVLDPRTLLGGEDAELAAVLKGVLSA